MPKANIFSLSSTTAEAPIQEGDAVLIIRRDGEVVPMTVGVDQKEVDAIRSKNPHDMSEKELDMALQGQTLFLLTMAAKSEPIMDFLTKVAAMTGANDLEKLQKAAQVH